MLGQSSLQNAAPIDGGLDPVAGKFPQRAKKFTPRVLVVDDEALVRWTLAETLGAAGFDIVEAADGHAALRAISEGATLPDIVLLDLRLPDYIDLQLLTIIRRLVPAMPVILMTAFGTPEVCAEARRVGVAGIIEKPFDLDTLNGIVNRALTTRPS